MALVQLPESVNWFPDFVRRTMRRLKALCPTMGKARIARTFAREDLHLAATTVGRALKEDGGPRKDSAPEAQEADGSSSDEADAAKKRIVTAKYPNHVWHVDLTAVPVPVLGVPWLPFALHQV